MYIYILLKQYGGKTIISFSYTTTLPTSAHIYMMHLALKCDNFNVKTSGGKDSGGPIEVV